MGRPEYIGFKRVRRKVTTVGQSTGISFPREVVEAGRVVRGAPYDLRAHRTGSGLVISVFVHDFGGGPDSD